MKHKCNGITLGNKYYWAMKIFYDYQIFYNQRFGGPSRYFVELYKNIIKLNKDVKIFSPININHHLKDLNISKIQKGIFLKKKI